MLRQASFTLLALGLAANAFAGPKEELHAAFTKFLAQSAFKGSISSTMNGRVTHSVVEFQVPDHYRIKVDGRPASMIIGDTMYIEVNGQSMKMPMPGLKMVAQYRDPRTVSQIEASLRIQDLGMDSVGGVPSHKYSYTITEPQQASCEVWVSSASGLPIQLHNTGKAMGRDVDTTITYSNYNDPSIQISAPN